MTQSYAIPAQATLSPAEDYAFLRAEGIRLLQALAGQSWTDYNTHDPGITILEQLCYALTDLGYRIGRPMADLLTGPDGGQAFPPPAFRARGILSSQPLSLDDFRRFLLSIEGVHNAWVEPARQAFPLLRLAESDDQGQSRVAFLTGPQDSFDALTSLRGLLNIKIEPDIPRGTGDPTGFSAALRQRVAAALMASRSLGADISDIRVLEPQFIRIEADLEAAEGINPAALLAEIYTRLDQYISPHPRFYTLGEMLAKGYAMEEIIEGPALARGYLDPAELPHFTKKEYLHGSDLIEVIMGTPGVRLVRTLSMVKLDHQTPAGTSEWALALDPGKYPQLEIPADGSTVHIRLRHGDASLNAAGFRQKWAAREARQSALPGPDELDAIPAPGRYRQPGLYQSFQRQFPQLYGLGENSLPLSAGPQRRALAKQLRAYLLFFDQLLANGFAQLEGFPNMFAFDKLGGPDYFTQRPDDVPELDSLLSGEPPPAEEPSDESSRKQRLLSHLLARFAENLPSPGALQAGQLGPDGPAYLQLKKNLLLNYPALSGGRPLGFNYSESAADSISNFEKRIAILLGIPDAGAGPDQEKERFWLVEHILLRPLPADRAQYNRDTPPGGLETIPEPAFLYEPAKPDPFSLQISLVFPIGAGRFAHSEFRAFVERLLRTEAPAHLQIGIYWLKPEALAPFETAYDTWKDILSRHGRTLSATDEARNEPLWRLREARNQLIDTLVANGAPFGYTYPLLDLPAAGTTIITEPNKKAKDKVVLEFTQEGVMYQLWDRNRQEFTGEPVPGTGGTITLESDEFSIDEHSESQSVENKFDIQAIKTINGQSLPEAWLQTEVDVITKVLALGLNVEIVGPTEINYHAGTTVRIHRPEIGVRYTLFSGPLQDRDFEYFRKPDGSLGYRINCETTEPERKYTPLNAPTGHLYDEYLDIAVPEGLLEEDISIKVEASFEGQDQAEYLDARVFVFVGPDPGVTAKRSADHKVRIDQPQSGVRYLLFQGENLISALAYRPGKALAPNPAGDLDNANTVFRVEVDLVPNMATTAPLLLQGQAGTISLKSQKLNTKLEADLTITEA